MASPSATKALRLKHHHLQHLKLITSPVPFSHGVRDEPTVVAKLLFTRGKSAWMLWPSVATCLQGDQWKPSNAKLPHSGQTVNENRLPKLDSVLENLPNMTKWSPTYLQTSTRCQLRDPYLLHPFAFSTTHRAGWWLRLPMDNLNSCIFHLQYCPNLGGSSGVSGGDVAASRNCLDVSKFAQSDCNAQPKVVVKWKHVEVCEGKRITSLNGLL